MKDEISLIELTLLIIVCGLFVPVMKQLLRQRKDIKKREKLYHDYFKYCNEDNSQDSEDITKKQKDK